MTIENAIKEEVELNIRVYKGLLKKELEDLKSVVEGMNDYESCQEKSFKHKFSRYLGFTNLTERIVRFYERIKVLEELIEEAKSQSGGEENEEEI